MPNHVINRISSSKIEAIKKLMASKESRFDFNQAIPMPKAIRNVGSPVTIVSEADYKKALENRRIELQGLRRKTEPDWLTPLPMTQAMSDKLIAEHGYNNWYDWACQKWDTKWNAYEVRIEKDYIQFQTAWNAPFKVIEAISKKFKCAITLEYADEDIGNNCGIVEIEDGVTIKHREADEEFAQDLWGYGPSDEEIQEKEIKKTIRSLSKNSNA